MKDINNILKELDLSIHKQSNKKKMITKGNDPIKGTSFLCIFLILSGLSIKLKYLPRLFLY